MLILTLHFLFFLHFLEVTDELEELEELEEFEELEELEEFEELDILQAEQLSDKEFIFLYFLCEELFSLSLHLLFLKIFANKLLINTRTGFIKLIIIKNIDKYVNKDIIVLTHILFLIKLSSKLIYNLILTNIEKQIKCIILIIIYFFLTPEEIFFICSNE